MTKFSVLGCRLKFWSALLAGAFLSASCSSVPDFKPSVPVEKASTLSEALSICASYQIEEQNGGTAQPVRVVTVVPWIRCLETTLRKFPEARANEGVVMFYRSLKSINDSAPTPSTKIVNVDEMNFAAKAIFNNLIDPNHLFTDRELQVIEQNLPNYAIFLAETGAYSRDRMKDRQGRVSTLERARQSYGLSEFHETQTATRIDRALSADQKTYCKDYLDYRAVVYNLEDLAQYKLLLDERKAANPNAPIRPSEQNIDVRFASSKEQALQLKSQLAKRLENLKSQAKWFNNAYCRTFGAN